MESWCESVWLQCPQSLMMSEGGWRGEGGGGGVWLTPGEAAWRSCSVWPSCLSERKVEREREVAVTQRELQILYPESLRE